MTQYVDDQIDEMGSVANKWEAAVRALWAIAYALASIADHLEKES